MQRKIDTICQQEGVYPHAFLCGHAQLRALHANGGFGGKEFDVPFIICGDGGHNVDPLVRAKKAKSPTTRRAASMSITSRPSLP